LPSAPDAPAPIAANLAVAALGSAAGAGRTCPLHYRYTPGGFARPAHWQCDTLYVVGGLYGNEPALRTVLDLFARERGNKRLLFNGDFHWFDTDPAAFRRINETVLAHDALRGNVETEIASLTNEMVGDADCGCAYPDWVGDDVVQRSNQILQRLHQTARAAPEQQVRLAALPMWLRVDVAGLRLAVVHGDAESLSGWGFAQEHLQNPSHQNTVRTWFDAAQVDAFACSHTCLPVFQQLARAESKQAPGVGRPAGRWVFNNGAAGMPNFEGQQSGLLTRIATTPFVGPERCLGLQAASVHVDAIHIHFDAAQWQQQFLAQWPPGSDAHRSYWQRMQAGPRYRPQAVLRHA
jgi:hypothetical protein